MVTKHFGMIFELRFPRRLAEKNTFTKDILFTLSEGTKRGGKEKARNIENKYLKEG